MIYKNKKDVAAIFKNSKKINAIYRGGFCVWKSDKTDKEKTNE
jgi:hypothetical protein